VPSARLKAPLWGAGLRMMIRIFRWHRWVAPAHLLVALLFALAA